MKLTLGADSLNILNWFIDSAHQVHEDSKGHSGGSLTLGQQGAVISKSSEQKMNTKSSSETELVGVDDLLPTVRWKNIS